MTLAAIFLLASQVASSDAVKQELDQLVSRTSSITDQAFACLERETKEQMKLQIEDGSPETIVDAALATCNRFKNLYAQAATGTYISPTKAQELAEDAFKNIREAYVAQAQKWLSDPIMAELRTKVVISRWRKCVTEKARDWSRLRDEATTVGSAAVTACASFERRVRSSFASELRAKKLPMSSANEVVEKAGETMRAVAIEAVISERAKHLPKR